MVILFVLIIGVATGYDFKCPTQAEWRLRASVSCISDDKYVCLFNTLAKKYVNDCTGLDKSIAGIKLVFSPWFNDANCNTERYQPVPFTTYGHSECMFLKSKCDEEGQLVYSNNSSVNDTGCLCDFNTGYAFVSKPKNSCFCKPSEEDCSCFRVNCTKLSVDYQCINEGEITNKTKCQEIHRQISYHTHNSTVQFIESDMKSDSNAPNVAFIIVVSMAVCIVFTILKVYVLVGPKLLSQEIIKSDDRNIGLKCYVRSYLPLTSVIWCKESGENICTDTKSNNVFSRKGIKTLTFETLEENDLATYKCIASNIIGTVESDPAQINDDERQQFIQELFLKGECGKHHFARLVFIGKNGVGKTSLMRRLLWQKKEDVISTKSTDGIEVQKCNISISDGKWSRCNKRTDDLTRIIDQVFKQTTQNLEKAATENVVVNESYGDDDDTDNDSYKSDYTSDFEINGRNINSLISDNIAHNATVETDLNDIQPENTDFQNVYENKIIRCSNESESIPLTDEELNRLISTIMTTCLQRTEPDNEDMKAFCWLWDFAGQKDFYATHQVFLSKCAVFLLVTDSLDFTTAETPGSDFENSAQYVSFWFDVIHCYWSTTKKGHLDPPIIVVCTNEDRFKKPGERQLRREKFEDNLSIILKKQKKKKHLKNVYFVSNTEDDDSVFEEIRKVISRQAMHMSDWGRVCPLKWLLFQQVLSTLKENGVPIFTTAQLSKIAKHVNIGITNGEEFKLCLQYCHDIGTVIYFEEKKLKDHVILDPKWLIDAFRCLVSDKIEHVIKISDDWQKLTETGELTDQLISSLFKKEPKLKFFENKTHLLELMKRFDIIVSLKNSTALYMPCMMKSCNFADVQKQFMDESRLFYRTSWLCLEFRFLPPAFFNHILAWYIKQYSVSVILDKGTRNERKALYRKVGVFNLDLSGCEQLVICEGPNVLALQVWNSRKSFKTYGDLGKNLSQFVDTLRYRYRLQISYRKSFKCKDGDFTTDRKNMKAALLTEDYRCLEHKKNHLSFDLIKPWDCGENLQKHYQVYHNTYTLPSMPMTDCKLCKVPTESEEFQKKKRDGKTENCLRCVKCKKLKSKK